MTTKRGLFTFACVVLLAGFVQVSLPAPGRAQALHDHLKCYKIKDATKFIATATLSALQSEFGVENCQLKGKARLLCAPVNKVVTSFDDKSKGQFGQLNFEGPDLSLDRICYKLKCPVSVIDPLEVTDQFGTRKVRKFKAVLLCTPAKKGALPTTTTTSSTTTTAVDLCAGVSCSASDPCHDVGVCDPATGLCSNPAKPNGSGCDDGDPCTGIDSCQDGVCTGPPYFCDDGRVCTDNVCAGDGSCSFPITAGNCLISAVCYVDSDLRPGNPCESCDAQADPAAWSVVPQGTPCDDGDPATFNDQCLNGVCVGTF